MTGNRIHFGQKTGITKNQTKANILFLKRASELCRRVNTAGLRAKSLEWPCKVGPWLASGDMGLGRVPTVLRTEKRCSLSLNCVAHAENLLSSWKSGTLVGRECLLDQPPGKTLGTESLTSLVCRQHFTHVVLTHFWTS